MLRSMTGFGRYSAKTKIGRLIIEVQAVNRRYLEVSTMLPKELFSFDLDIKRWVSEKIFRGQVTVRIFFYPDEKNIQSFLPDKIFLKKLKTGWENIAEYLDYDPKTIDLSFLISQSRNFSQAEEIKDQDLYKTALNESLEKALDNLVKMKIKEGINLTADIKNRISLVKKIVILINKRAPIAKEASINNLKAKFDLLPKKEEEKDDFIKIAAIYTDKIDITEELTRLNSHIGQFEDIFKTKEDSVGKKMDFIMQEMIRESNTIASKAQDSKIAKHIIEIKTELEKIREQIQNIE